MSSEVALYEINKAIERLETVERRLMHALRGKEWTRRPHDADIIAIDCIPALRRALESLNQPTATSAEKV